MAKEAVKKAVVTGGLTKEQKQGWTIAKCINCKEHPYQDAKYGNLMRYMNYSKSQGYGCSVCGKYLK